PSRATRSKAVSWSKSIEDIDAKYRINRLDRCTPWSQDWGRRQRMIRLATPDDAGDVAAIYAPVVRATAISFELDPPTKAEMAARIEAALSFAPWLVAADERGVQGFAYASKHRERAAYRWSVDASVYVHERARRRGLARGLYTSLFA